MKSASIKCLAAMSFAFAMGNAAATAININFSKYALGTAVTNQVAGVTFSLMGASNSVGAPVISNYEGFGLIGLSNSISGDYPTAEILDMKFSGATSNISFTLDNIGDNTGYGVLGSGTYYSAFDANGLLLETGVTGPGGAFTLNASGVFDLQINNDSGSEHDWIFTVGALNATVSDVPEPASLALLGLGLVGAAVARRKASHS